MCRRGVAAFLIAAWLASPPHPAFPQERPITPNEPLPEGFYRTCADVDGAQAMNDIGHSFAARNAAPREGLELVPHRCYQGPMIVPPVRKETDINVASSLNYFYSPSSIAFLEADDLRIPFAWAAQVPTYYWARITIDDADYHGIVEIFPTEIMEQYSSRNAPPN
jgi:hypothetical protein